MKRCADCDETVYTGDDNEFWCPEVKHRVRKDSRCQKTKDS